MQLFTEADVEPGALRGERIAVLGYGSQGRAHALNLRDSGYDVVVGLRPGGKTSATAERDGLHVQGAGRGGRKAPASWRSWCRISRRRSFIRRSSRT